MSENHDLNAVSTKAAYPRNVRSKKDLVEESEERQCNLSNFIQYATSDDKIFFPTSRTVQLLPPGFYEIKRSPDGTYYEKIPVKTEGLIRFPQTNADKVLQEIQSFWEREDAFKEYSISYRRGIILYGPPAGGKTCVIQLICRDLLERGGVIFKFTNPSLFLDGIRKFREIQKNTPLVVLMEDLDAILDCHNESEVLNILDGIDRIEKCIFLATTNYPGDLGARIMNRPSRFDKRFHIGLPNKETREIYLRHLIKDHCVNINIRRWIEDTEGFTVAHLKELFVTVNILGNEYEDAIKILKEMKEVVKQRDCDDETPIVGFHR